jgi:two-component system chemotaxis response regulator CheB
VSRVRRGPIRILIVDDSAFVRRALARILSSEPDLEVVGEAVDGLDCLEKVRTLAPDVVTLDVHMPRMGGLEALERIMRDYPVPVLLLSSLTRRGGEVTLRGLELGAMDFVDKSSVQGNMNLLNLGDELRAKVRAISHVPRRRLQDLGHLAATERLSAEPGTRPSCVEAVAIGTSTGGPPALQSIVPRLPSALGTAIVVVQHMPVGFTRSLADRLAALSAVPVREAVDGEPVVPGNVLIAPAGIHMKLRRRGSSVRISLDEEPRATLHRPSADVLMTSVAQVYGPRALGVVLTGMGSDGVVGLRAIRDSGGRTFAEAEESCVIYGMPKAAVEAGVVDRSIPLARMADEILAAV